MNRMNNKPVSTNMSSLMPEDAFMSLSDYNSEQVKTYILDPDQHQKTVKMMLQNILKEKIKERQKK